MQTEPHITLLRYSIAFLFFIFKLQNMLQTAMQRSYFASLCKINVKNTQCLVVNFFDVISKSLLLFC